jgi:hypothetical protein
MSPELKRSLIKFVPDYFSWDKKRQEQYLVDMPKEDFSNIQQFLLKELFNISVSSVEEIELAWRAMNDAQSLIINAILLPLQGIGEDSFYLNEFFPDQKNLLNFETLYDYDFDDYMFQEDARIAELKDYQRKPYRGSLYFTWARLIIDGNFSYGSLSMVPGYLCSLLDEYGSDYVQKLIPYEFKHGENHGKAELSGYLFDIKADAKGMEQQLDELQRRFWEHISKVHERLAAEFDKESQQFVFIFNNSTDNDPNHHFLFTDKEILKRIHFRTFLRDCRAVEQIDHTLLFGKLEKEKQSLAKYLDAQYKDIIENFDSKILGFRKRRKVIFQKDSGIDELLR